MQERIIVLFVGTDGLQKGNKKENGDVQPQAPIGGVAWGPSRRALCTELC